MSSETELGAALFPSFVGVCLIDSLAVSACFRAIGQWASLTRSDLVSFPACQLIWRATRIPIIHK